VEKRKEINIDILKMLPEKQHLFFKCSIMQNRIFISLFLIIFLNSFSFAQRNERDSLLSTPIYDEMLNAINSSAEEDISRRLSKMSLKDLVDREIISRKDMEGLALPLGVYKKTGNIDFAAGIYDMWMSKARNAQKSSSGKIEASAMITAIEAIELFRNNKTTKSDIRNYRNTVLVPACDTMRKLHAEMQRLYSSERLTFMNLIADNLSANILLGYNIQEMMPPTHMTAKRQIVDVNPIFKVYYFDRLLQEAGYEFICYFPARYDGLHSLGPFQFTDIALKDIKVNSRLIDKFKIFGKTTDLKTIDDHALAAVLFAYSNWERLSYILKTEGLLKNFNAFFTDFDTNSEKRRILRIFIAGLTACMHHNPPDSFEAIKKYLKQNQDLSKMHYSWISKTDSKQLYKYYRSAAEAYLILKVYDKLFME
jgi:hypothetical protein